ncbi:MAG TPA: hypothetical protein PLY93_09250, partial [Turneriella sp.]|nr:hypothetical protein [Turneriella sp.]
YYTFMRRHDAQTTQKENADACSHCGTPFALEGELTKCKSCGAVEGSGTFDWVLAEITQEIEYNGLTSRKDIAEPWSADRIEDRASYLFWRNILAQCKGDAQVLQRDATDEYREKGIQKTVYYQAAVGAADLTSLKERDGVLYASVRIKWSAAKNPKAEPTHAESILTLAAKREAAEATTFADPGCASCGAPLPESDSATCAYCHAPVTKKNSDWLLVDVQNG